MLGMTRGIRFRLLAFVILSAVGVTYVTASYLGLVDRITGRNITVTATLPTSGGLFEGSEVTYRGFKIGEVSRMPLDKGQAVRIRLTRPLVYSLTSEEVGKETNWLLTLADKIQATPLPLMM